MAFADADMRPKHSAIFEYRLESAVGMIQDPRDRDDELSVARIALRSIRLSDHLVKTDSLMVFQAMHKDPPDTYIVKDNGFYVFPDRNTPPPLEPAPVNSPAH